MVRSGRWFMAAGLVVWAAGSVSAPVAAAPVTPPPGGFALVPTGVINATGPSLSDDGRWVVYGGTLDDSRPDAGRRSVFRTDLREGTVTELSPVPAGVRPGDTILPQISADGCVVVAITQVAYDLFRDDDRDLRWDVYRLLLPDCGGQVNGWELISSDYTGVARDGVFTESPPAVSGSGAVVAYVHQSDTTLARLASISVVDVTTPIDDPARSTEVRGMPVEAPGRAYRYHGAYQPALSRNGRHLAFTSDALASDPLPGWAPGVERGGWASTQVYVWDRLAADQARAVHLVSGVRGAGGAPSALGADSPVMSEDGRVIVFTSPDRDLVPAILPRCDTACPTQIFRFDRDTDGNGVFDEPSRPPGLALVSALAAGQVASGLPTAGNGASWSPAVNADGSSIAFVTDATNLLPSRRAGGGTVRDGDLVVAEYHLGQLRRVLDSEALVDVPGAHNRPAMSRTGQVLVFDTLAGRALAAHGTVGEGQPAPDPGRGRTLATTKVVPQLALAALDFGSVLQAFESTELTASVQNAGPAAFEVGNVWIDEEVFHITGGSCTRGIVVAAGSSCSVKLTFNPRDPRGYAGQLTIGGLIPADPFVQASVQGAAGDPTLLATPGGVDLPAGEVGRFAGKVAISIENVGFVPVQVADVRLGGNDPGDFGVIGEACTGRALNAQATCAVEVEFRPGSPGYHSALVVVTTTIGQYTAAVIGGYAHYNPTFAVASDLVTAGDSFGVGGDGFPPGSTVRIGFDDGGTPLAEVPVNQDGAFLAVLDMPGLVRGGERRLVATGTDGAVATADVIVRTAAPQVLPGTPGSGT